MGAGSVNIGVLLSEKLLPTVGLRLVFTESSESTKEEGDTHRHTHARQKKKKKKIHQHIQTQTDIRTIYVQEQKCVQMQMQMGRHSEEGVGGWGKESQVVHNVNTRSCPTAYYQLFTGVLLDFSVCSAILLLIYRHVIRADRGT